MTIDRNKFDEYENGIITLDELNKYLAQFNMVYDPENNTITEDGAVPCSDVTKINGYALVDTGVGGFNKMMVKNGHLVDNIGEIRAYAYVGDTCYNIIHGEILVK